MTDWADEIAERLNPYFRNPDFPFEGIAAALRKTAEDNYRRGKADGMMEATFRPKKLSYSKRRSLVDAVCRISAAIEKGTPND